MDAKVFEMNHKDAIQYLKGLVVTQEITEHAIRRNLVINMCIEALEKAPVLEAENARLRELAFNHCSLHGKAFGNTPNYQKMFCDGKCEGYCRGVDDDEPIDECKECIINEFYEE